MSLKTDLAAFRSGSAGNFFWRERPGNEWGLIRFHGSLGRRG
jgi:hypothetical protein